MICFAVRGCIPAKKTQLAQRLLGDAFA